MSTSFEHNLDQYSVSRASIELGWCRGTFSWDSVWTWNVLIPRERFRPAVIFTVVPKRADPSLQYCTGKYVWDRICCPPRGHDHDQTMPRWRFDTSTTLLWSRGPRVPRLLRVHGAGGLWFAVLLSPLTQGFRSEGRTTRPVRVQSDGSWMYNVSRNGSFRTFGIHFKYLLLLCNSGSVNIGGLLSAWQLHALRNHIMK